MYIGKVSKLTGASRKAIHHYEEIGLLQGIVRSGKYRTYNEHHVVIISMIKRAQALGFTLAEIEPLVLTKHAENRFPLDLANAAIEEKRAKIKLEIQKAKEIDSGLSSLKKELQVLFTNTQ
ncbi:MAG: MerR family transcriptional regulator [Gammaproteobacteria bacterium]|nr:MAG: MerR family transcriptional regulator [Gammaproteobacteria bacterium]